MSLVLSREIVTGQNALSTTSEVAVAARPGRRRVIIKNIDSSITIYLAHTTATNANSMVLLAGESIALETEDAVHGLAASGTTSIAYVEEF